MRFLTLSALATLLAAPAFAADLGTYRPGTPYHSSVAAGADVCDNQCAGDAQCRGWNYVKPNPLAPGVCEYLSTVSSPIASQISISGENVSGASFSSRVTSGGTNTIRVGTQVPQSNNPVRVGAAPAPRRVIRQAVPQQAKSQRASTLPVENMSLTAQQNRYRHGQVAQPQRPVRAAIPQAPIRPAMPPQGPMFRPMLDAPAPAASPQAARQPRQRGRRITGPRNAAPAPAAAPYPPQAAPQVARGQAPYPQNPAWQREAPHVQAPQNQVMARGSSRPPVGQPIAPPPQVAPPAAQPRPSTPSQRLAQFKAQTPAVSQPIPSQGPVALSPQQARKSLFGSLNDDLRTPTTSDLPNAAAAPTTPVTQQELGAVLAGGL